jgi:hypothetical protein
MKIRPRHSFARRNGLAGATFSACFEPPASQAHGQAKDWKPLKWHGYYSLRRGIATQLNTITRNPMAAKGLLRHSSANTTLIHYIKEVPEVTANGMAQVEQLFNELDSDEQAVQ